MKIQKYLDFVNEGKEHSYGCLMLEFDIKNWNDILDTINPDDVSDVKKGLEEEPHVTIFYGLEDDKIDDSDIIEFMKGVEPIDVKIFNIEVFNNDEFDVLKYNVESEQLTKIHYEIKKKFPNTTDFPDYKPHMTIAFLKPGRGNKYAKKFRPMTFTSVDEVTYSKSDDTKIKIKL